MMKIVVTWWSGSSHEGGEITTCLMYESAEALYVHLEAAVKQYVAKEKDYFLSMKKWREEYHPVIEKISKITDRAGKPLKNKEQLFEAIMELATEIYKRRPKLENKQEVTLNGVQFPCSEFVKSMHDIQTLEEWFEEKKEN
jgi:hypothetical protein